MRRKIHRSTMILGLTALVFSCAAIAVEYWPSSTEVEWLELDAALVRASQTSRRVYLDVYAQWCLPCRRMDRDVFQNDSVLAVLRETVIPARVDLDSELGRRVRTEYSISAVPTSLLLNDLGQEAKRRVGGMSADQFLGWLKDPKESVFASWQPYAFAQITAKESHRPLVVLVIKDKSEFEILESAFGKASTQEFIQNAFVPTLLVESVEADKRIIDGFGGTVIPNQTLGALLVFEEGSREVARVPVTMRMVWSESEMMQTLLPYSGSRAARPSASLR